ncbi:MAG: DUF1127 domain-containing protein [Hyphomicrobiaceae bacterium]|nr:DUF1127 domain-containing protein [Hyphomicrobiaceae bacterium]
MTSTNTASAPARMALWPGWDLAALAGRLIASAVLRRAERKARRELAALDDRTLEDMGLVRADLTALLDALAERRAAVALSRSPCNCRRLGV